MRTHWKVYVDGLDIYSFSFFKTKKNSKSSTETGVVGVRKELTFLVWYVDYMGEQGFNIKRYILHKDITSSICM